MEKKRSVAPGTLGPPRLDFSDVLSYKFCQAWEMIFSIILLEYDNAFLLIKSAKQTSIYIFDFNYRNIPSEEAKQVKSQDPRKKVGNGR